MEARTYTQDELDAAVREAIQQTERELRETIERELAEQMNRRIDELAQGAAVAIEKAANVAAKRVERAGYERAMKEIIERRAEGYHMGLADEGQCGAVCPNLTYLGRPVRCQREAGHPLGVVDRHKAVYGQPHQAVVWNEPVDAGG